MRYDLPLIQERCQEIGLPSRLQGESLEIELKPGVMLRFLNASRDEDCLVGFDGTQWHTHGDLVFAGGQGAYVEMSILDVVAGLKDGSILVCERWNDGQLKDRCLVHRDYNDEFKFMSEGEEIKVWRVAVEKPDHV